MAASVSTADGRRAFGDDPAAYDAARPAYPDWVFDRLAERGALFNGAAAFEIGPGAGLATRGVLARGASVIAIEPDARLAAFLAGQALPGLAVRGEAFEDADLAPEAYDLGLAATAFHWLDQSTALAKVARSLKPGGWWAMFANVFGDPDRADAFHDATTTVLGALPSGPSGGSGALPYALDHAARITDLDAAGAFTDITAEQRPWTLVLDPGQVRALYATYSNITLRPPRERERILGQLQEIAETEFDRRVERNMVTSLHMARRR